MNTQSRAPKQLGDFGEGLVTYALIRKGFEVAVVDHGIEIEEEYVEIIKDRLSENYQPILALGRMKKSTGTTKNGEWSAGASVPGEHFMMLKR